MTKNMSEIKQVPIGSVHINGKEKDSLISQYEQHWDDIVEAATATPTSRERVFELLEIHEIETAEIIAGEQYVYANENAGSLFQLARRYADSLADLRQTIEQFEKHAIDSGEISRFYDAMKIGLELAGDLEILTIKRHEKAIIRGADNTYSGNSNLSLTTQREIVRFVREAMQGDDALGKNEAIRTAQEKYQVSRSSINRFLKKF